VKVKADIAVMRPKAKDCPQPSETGRGKEGFFSRGMKPYQHLICLLVSRIRRE
jgi:hypothetical protein